VKIKKLDVLHLVVIGLAVGARADVHARLALANRLVSSPPLIVRVN
jgi:hypothetical protein